MTAKIVAIEGIDGSGKGTQSGRLVENLLGEGRAVSLLSFPRYSDTRFGAAIGDFLNGRFGSLEQVSPFLASVLYAGDRFESKALIEKAVSECDVLIFDRYTASNIAHQGAKVTAAERDEIIEFIEGIEHDVFGLPRADLTLLMDISVELSQALIRKKAPRDYTDQAADLQEADVAYMSGVRDVYQSLAARGSWQAIPCESNGELRSLDDIAGDAQQAVSAIL